MSMIDTSRYSELALVEPDDRLVVLARTLQATDPTAETQLKKQAESIERGAETWIGNALYRHDSVYQSASDAPVWSHFELMYFRGFVPADTIRQLAVNPHEDRVELLRAEILLSTPSSFVLPRGWEGSADHPERTSSLEFLQVQPKHLDEYRKAMLEYCGPAAQTLVRTGRFGTFRAMETAVVLYHDPTFETDWNQVHLCELNPDGFEGFGKEFEAVHRQELSADAEFSDTFASLGRLRTIPRWTFNDPVVEADAALAR